MKIRDYVKHALIGLLIGLAFLAIVLGTIVALNQPANPEPDQPPVTQAPTRAVESFDELRQEQACGAMRNGATEEQMLASAADNNLTTDQVREIIAACQN